MKITKYRAVFIIILLFTIMECVFILSQKLKGTNIEVRSGVLIKRKVLKFVSNNFQPPYTWNNRIPIYVFSNEYEIITNEIYGKSIEKYCHKCHIPFRQIIDYQRINGFCMEY